MQQRTFGKRNAGTGAGLRAADANAPFGEPNSWRGHIPIIVIGLAVVGVLCIAAPAMIGPAATAPTPAIVAIPGNMIWVTSQRLERHSCPSSGCGIVGSLFYREGVQPLEAKGNWTRITDYYAASCVNGQSDYVDSGNAQCSEINGVVDGKLAEWVETASLSATRPSDPAEGETGLVKSIAGSDDFNMYRPLFLQAAQKLVDQGLCTEQELAESGGFLESQNLKPRKVYFVRCGDQKYYADLTTMEIFQ